MKQILHRLQPIQVYVVLVLSVCYFAVQMYISQKSQSITLLVHTYHMLCNIIALSGCIITIKQSDQESKRLSKSDSDSSVEFGEDQQQKEIVSKHMTEKKKQQRQHEKSLKNTFGWARVDVLTMVIVCTFLTSLCFSVVVEVIQTLFHIQHNDHVEHSTEFHSYTYETCIALAVLGLVLNGISYLLIGGYTYHQGSFLHLTPDGTVYILDSVVEDGRKISDSKDAKDERKSLKIHKLARDTCSAIMVIICSLIIVLFGEHESLSVRLVDPVLSLVSIAILLVLSYPYMKEAAQILLQTIPDTIDIEGFQKQIIQKFPEIRSIHDLHIWQLTQQKFVSTAHIIFLDPSVYKLIINDVLGFFHEQGINIITIQPEFLSLGSEEPSPSEERKPLVDRPMKNCLVACRQTECVEKLCCKHGSIDSVKSELQQVVSIKDVSDEELTTLANSKSANSLNLCEPEESTQYIAGKKRSSASLYNPTQQRHKHKLQHAVSAIDRDHQKVTAKSTSDDIHLTPMKKFVSESVIKSGDHDDQGLENSEIFVENNMQRQLDTTDNNEMEDLHDKCDREK